MTAATANRTVLLTPPGSGAIGVVRVIGPDASAILAELFRLRSGEAWPGLADDRLHYGRFAAGEEPIDDVVVSHVPDSEPRAFDICMHGGVRVATRIISSLEKHGACLTMPDDEQVSIWPAGNLIEREIAKALTIAKTGRAVRMLCWQRTHLAARLGQVAQLCRVQPKRAQAELEDLIARFSAARALIEGATVAIIGPANSGKSTLFNHLVGRSAALVSAQAGTTRDWVTSCVEVGGVALTLVDTAGYHSRGGLLEGKGVGAGWDQARRADLCLVVLDGSAPLTDEARTMWQESQSLRSCLTVLNKLDICAAWDEGALTGGREDAASGIVRMSARTGRGSGRLIELLLAFLQLDGRSDNEPCLLTRRQVVLAQRAVSDLAQNPPAAAEAIKWCLVDE